MYSSLSNTLSLSLVIVLLLRSCVCQTQALSQSESVLSTRCPSHSSDVWWKPLEWHGQDPCALSHNLRQQNNATAHIGCCSLQSGVSSHTPPCGPCNLQTYNIAVACLACVQPSTLNVTTAVVRSEIANNSLVIPTTKQWQVGRDQPPDLELKLPPWVSVLPDTNDKFDVERVVQNATQSSGSTSLNLSASPVISSPSSTSSPAGHTTFITVPPTSSPSPSRAVISSTQQLSSFHKNAGIIAGGVLGGTISLALVALAILLIRRRRRMHLAPSAEFMPVVGPRAGHTSQDDSPPPFSPGMWRDPVLEKVHSASTA